MSSAKKFSKAAKTKYISYKKINIQDDLDSDELEAMIKALPDEVNLRGLF